MKSLSVRLTSLISGLAFVLLLTASPTQADEWNRETKITPSQSLEVPGAVLEGGFPVNSRHPLCYSSFLFGLHRKAAVYHPDEEEYRG